jgi:hypothetical protein
MDRGGLSMHGNRWLVTATLAVLLILTPSTALAGRISGRIVENVGIKRAKLNLHDTTDRRRLGWKYRRVVDRDYQGAGYTVYEYYFGKKSSKTHKYPVEMYAKSNHHVFTFIVNSPFLKTKNGTHVGTTEGALTSRYGAKLTQHTTPTYTYYTMGTSKGLTEFWCKSGKVHHIVIARY